MANEQLKINDNTINLSRFKGPIKRCPLCNVENTMMGRSCTLCFDKKFVAECLNCHHTGLQKLPAVWDGGASTHESPCPSCGGSGYFPALKPKDWKDEIQVEGQVVDKVVDNTVDVTQ